jgi:hypothetical protein
MAVAILVNAGQDGVEVDGALVQEFALGCAVLKMIAPRQHNDQGCQRLSLVFPDDSGCLSPNCGAIMRVAHWTLLQRSFELRLAAWASSSDPCTRSGRCGSHSLLCFWAVGGVPPSEYWDRIKALQPESVQAWEPVLGKSWETAGYASPKVYLTQGWKELLFEFDKIPQAMAKDSTDICDILGGGWGSDEALACALACVLRFPKDYAKRSNESGTRRFRFDCFHCQCHYGASWAIMLCPDWRKRSKPAASD